MWAASRPLPKVISEGRNPRVSGWVWAASQPLPKVIIEGLQAHVLLLRDGQLISAKVNLQVLWGGALCAEIPGGGRGGAFKCEWELFFFFLNVPHFFALVCSHRALDLE